MATGADVAEGNASRGPAETRAPVLRSSGSRGSTASRMRSAQASLLMRGSASSPSAPMMVISFSPRAEPDAVDRDVVVDDQVEALARALGAGALEAGRRRARPRSPPAPGAPARAARSARMSSVGSRSRARRALGATCRSCPPGRSPGRKSATAAAITRTSQEGKAARAARVQVGRRRGVDVADVRVAGQLDVGGEHGDLARRAGAPPRPPPSPCARWSGCPRSAPGRSARACRRRSPAPGGPRGSRRRRAGASTASAISTGSASRPTPISPSASRPEPGAMTWTPRATQQREVGGRGRVEVHARVHGRGDQHRPVEGEVHRAEQPVAEARGHPRHRCWPTPARPAAGRRRGRARGGRSPARPSAPNRSSAHGPARERGEGGGPHEALGGPRSSRRSRRGPGAGGCAGRRPTCRRRCRPRRPAGLSHAAPRPVAAASTCGELLDGDRRRPR